MKKRLLSLSIAVSVFSVANGGEIKVDKGWQLLGAIEDINSTNIFNSNCVSSVWTYDKKWSAFSPDLATQNSLSSANIDIVTSIKKETGFWINANDTCTISTNSSVTTNYLLAMDEPLFKYAWHLDSKNSVINSLSGKTYIDNNADINITDAWKLTMGNGVKVAVIDDNYDIEHEDLKDNILLTYNADDGSQNAQNTTGEYSHGNTCAGFVVSPVNSKGSVGVAPEAKLIAIKLEGSDDAKTISAFEYAKNNGAKVINCSWGTENISQAVEDELKSLYEAGITVVFASGNDAYDLDTAGLNDESESEWVIGVGATSEKNDVTSYSNYGNNIDIVAPGGDTDIWGILGLDNSGENGDDNYLYQSDSEKYYDESSNPLIGNNYTFTNGTSFSAPVTTGVIALMYGVNPNITPAQIKEILIQTADKIGDTTYNQNGFDNEKKRAYGKINAGAAVAAAKALSN